MKLTGNIKNIIFDLGGVLLNIDYFKTVESFKAIGLANPEKAFTKEIQSEIFQAFERGEMKSEEFLSRLNEKMPMASNDQIKHAWNALLEDFPEHRFLMLKALRPKYNLAILSNTNAIHEIAFKKTIDNSIGWSDFENQFDYIAYSHVLHDRKPNPGIFEKTLEICGYLAEETLFIDDTEEHVLTARSIGIQAVHLKSGDVGELLRDLEIF